MTKPKRQLCTSEGVLGPRELRAEELELRAARLRFRKYAGEGPEEGWVSAPCLESSLGGVVETMQELHKDCRENLQGSEDPHVCARFRSAQDSRARLFARFMTNCCIQAFTCGCCLI